MKLPKVQSESVKQSARCLLLGLFLTVVPASLRAQHLNAGAVGTNQGSQLVFANAGAFLAESGYLGRTTYTNGGTYRGYYQIGLTPTALPATLANGGPVAGAPALGSFIRMRIESVVGPDGGAFAFWESGATNPSVSVSNGGGPSMLFPLSDAGLGAGVPGNDPFGHLHGRRFTASRAGLYTVGFKIFDTSTNGVGGGPIHLPSEVLNINFTTTVALAMKRIERTNDAAATLTIHQGGLTNVFVEASSDPRATTWSQVAGPFTNAPFGATSTTRIVDTNASNVIRFYRLRGIAP